MCMKWSKKHRYVSKSGVSELFCRRNVVLCVNQLISHDLSSDDVLIQDLHFGSVKAMANATTCQICQEKQIRLWGRQLSKRQVQ